MRPEPKPGLTAGLISIPPDLLRDPRTWRAKAAPATTGAPLRSARVSLLPLALVRA